VDDETPIYDDLVAALRGRASRPSPTEWPTGDPDPTNASSAVSASGKHVMSPSHPPDNGRETSRSR
jgi:hypothetical protein